MRITVQTACCAILLSAIAIPASAQSPASAIDSTDPSSLATPVPSGPPTVQQLLESSTTGIKFDVRDLMEILRDRRHEGWVLAAYPDPKTAQPLIGAGVSLDLPARPHPQSDPLNPHGFLEPSSADLWQAAGLDPDRLHTILDQFQHRMAAWDKKGFRKRIKTLEPEINDDEATLLLRVSALQAIYNARGYCRCFDQLTPSQQMALSQLVYQMGVNLQEFNQFLDQINNYTQVSNNAAGTESASSPPAPLLAIRANMATDAEYWKTVQQSLVQSQWARLYRVRAVSVIAMLDPQYQDEPSSAEHRIALLLHPAVVHQRRGHALTTKRVAAHSPARKGHSSPATRRSKLHQRTKRGV